MAFTDQRGRTQTSLSEINVTPLVDVMLVLLVIFMVTAPILQTGIEVSLPKTRETRTDQPKPRSVVVSIDKDGNIYLSTQSEARQVNVNDLPALLSEKLGQSGERRVYVRGDGDTPYRIIAYVLDIAKQAGADAEKEVMMRNLTNDSRSERGAPGLSILLSIALHVVVLVGMFLFYQWDATRTIVAAGPGEGGEGGGGAIEVGVTDSSAILGFARPQPISHIGDEESSINNARVETLRREPERADEVLPSTDKESPNPDSLKTDRPVVNQQERIFTGKDERGRSQSQAAQVGRSFGSPTPALIGGVGIGSGGGFGGGTGLPGGSEYGRRIQSILSRNFNPPAVDTEGVQYVVIVLRIARDGTILSVSNGRISPSYFKQRSPLGQINYAAERAVLAANPLPRMPDGFLMSAQEVSAEVWFRYPK